MTVLNAKTLSEIQKAGSAISSASEEVMKSLKVCAKQSTDEMTNDPLSGKMEGLMAQWKSIGILKRSIDELEAHALRVFNEVTAFMASQPVEQKETVATAGSTTSAASAAKPAEVPSKSPAASPKVKIKPAKKSAKSAKKAPKASVATAAVVSVEAAAAAPAPVATTEAVPATSEAPRSRIAELLAKRKPNPARRIDIGGNPGKLMRYLETILSEKEFQKVNQTEAAKVAVIPAGSVNAALRKLVSLKAVEVGEGGGYRLTQPIKANA